jgi:hypothetical protein
LLCRDLLGEGGGERGGIELGSWEVRLIQLLRRASWKQGKNNVAQKEKGRKEKDTVEKLENQRFSASSMSSQRLFSKLIASIMVYYIRVCWGWVVA